MSAFRILVTGSREWTDWDVVMRALDEAQAMMPTAGKAVLVHGAAEGADLIAASLWAAWQQRLPEAFAQAEGYPARDFPSPRARNQHLVDLGADVCLTFAHTWASGTGMCARMARRAGIRVIDYGVDTSSEARP